MPNEVDLDIIVSLVLLYPLLWATYAMGKSAGLQEGAARVQVELTATQSQLEAAHVSAKRLNDEAEACSQALGKVYKDPDALARALGLTITPTK